MSWRCFLKVVIPVIIYTYINVFFFSFLPMPLSIVLFWHDDKTKKSTISNQNQAPDMLLQKNTIRHIYFTFVIITLPTYTITFCYSPKLNLVNLCNTYNQRNTGTGKIDLIPSSFTSSYFIGSFYFILFFIFYKQSHYQPKYPHKKNTLILNKTQI